ncbi:hypothetical protein GsuE55_32630 [Geobacillus subterraneus]|uniref:Uncharacterized protein n=1 Tax=Geobacillus subterraneus TaxID=129338 RepID=A0A679FQS0_9BACL|nr:hypothetical protein B4113_3686 [Geobacillus sp. B4113_201601]BBW98430.1 hypothetical protein GsuE55_32630 [Geobacillus subterraneus]
MHKIKITSVKKEIDVKVFFVCIRKLNSVNYLDIIDVDII